MSKNKTTSRTSFIAKFRAGFNKTNPETEAMKMNEQNAEVKRVLDARKNKKKGSK